MIKAVNACRKLFVLILMFTIKEVFTLEIISIIYTNSANGYLESCDCPKLPYGGLVRRVAAVKEIRKKVKNLLVVDSGDLLPAQEDKLLSEYCIKIAKQCLYDAVNIGDQEILNSIYENKPNWEKITFVSANLNVGKNMMEIKKFVIKKIGRLKIALTGIVDKETFSLVGRQKIDKIQIYDYKEVLEKLLPQLKSVYKVDLIILLSHLGLIKDIKLAEEVGGIDVIVSGHSQDFIDPPLKIKDTIIVQAGENGYYIGRLDLWIDKTKPTGSKIVNYKNSFILLDKTIEDDPQSKKLVKEYQEKLKKKLEKLKIK